MSEVDSMETKPMLQIGGLEKVLKGYWNRNTVTIDRQSET
ncbi:MAG: hypothetical protein ACJATI_004061 [Halioglobus sp.]|jgi:hypothetical protein